VSLGIALPDGNELAVATDRASTDARVVAGAGRGTRTLASLKGTLIYSIVDCAPTSSPMGA
jgi:hypothetical protein